MTHRLAPRVFHPLPLLAGAARSYQSFPSYDRSETRNTNGKHLRYSVITVAAPTARASAGDGNTRGKNLVEFGAVISLVARLEKTNLNARLDNATLIVLDRSARRIARGHTRKKKENFLLPKEYLSSNEADYPSEIFRKSRGTLFLLFLLSLLNQEDYV